jgi:hypothetical protein
MIITTGTFRTSFQPWMPVFFCFHLLLDRVNKKALEKVCYDLTAGQSNEGGGTIFQWPTTQHHIKQFLPELYRSVYFDRSVLWAIDLPHKFKIDFSVIDLV